MKPLKGARDPRGDAMPQVAELIGLGASAEHRTRDDTPKDPIYFVVMHDPESIEFCVG